MQVPAETYPSSIETDEIQALIAKLDADNAEAEDAVRRLRALGAEAIGPLLARMQAETRARRNNGWLRAGMIVLAAAFYIWLAPHLASPAYWPLLLVFIPVTWKIMKLSAASSLQIHGAKVLGAIKDIRAIGPLSEALEFSDLWKYSGTTRMAADALTELLKNVRPEDSALLDARQRGCLYRVLDSSALYEQELAGSILTALAQVGDQSAVAPLTRMVNRPSSATYQDLREQARQTLDALQARLESERAPQLLLRPSATPSETLLRSAAPTSETAPEQLLHATAQDE